MMYNSLVLTQLLLCNLVFFMFFFCWHSDASASLCQQKVCGERFLSKPCLTQLPRCVNSCFTNLITSPS